MNYFETDKFTNTSISVRSFLPFNKETITACNLMLLMMKARTEQLDTKQKFAMALSEAYGLKTGYSMTCYGSSVCIDLKLQYIRTDFIDEKDYPSKILNLIEQCISHPYFSKDAFDEAKYLLTEQLMRMQDDPDYLAVTEAMKIAKGSETLPIPARGSLEDLKHTTYEDVLAVYKKYRKADKFVSVIGHVNPRILTYLETVDASYDPVVEYKIVKPEGLEETVISKKISQTSLVQLYSTGIRLDSQYYYPLVVLNGVLGQGPMSLLFEEVREKNSLCYSISSSLLRFDGAMMIICGTSRKDLKKAVEIIDEQIGRVKTGDFSDKELQIAKLDLIDSINSQEDRPFEKMEQDFMDRVLKRPLKSADERIERIRSVTREEIMEAASKLVMISQAVIEQKGDEDEV